MRNYLIQNQPDSEKLLLEMADLEREYEDFRKNPLVYNTDQLLADLLHHAADPEFCFQIFMDKRILAEVLILPLQISQELVSVIDLELDDIEDAIIL